VVVGGVAGGASAAARARRLDERASIIVFEKVGNLPVTSCTPGILRPCGGRGGGAGGAGGRRDSCLRWRRLCCEGGMVGRGKVRCGELEFHRVRAHESS
jgi:hypothetical protein